MCILFPIKRFELNHFFFQPTEIFYTLRQPNLVLFIGYLGKRDPKLRTADLDIKDEYIFFYYFFFFGEGADIIFSQSFTDLVVLTYF